MEEINLRNYAYLGDAVWELFIREKQSTSRIIQKTSPNYNQYGKNTYPE